MTRSEFEAWKKETESSRFQWRRDQVFEHNQYFLFIYRGGPEKGSYISITHQGLVEVGTYIDAEPHIGDATFHVTGTHQCKDTNDAMTRVMQALGIQGTIDILV